jgi:hypothetical protein
MLKILNHGMRTSALAAAACAAVILVASPVSAGTLDEQGRGAATFVRKAILADCAKHEGKSKSSCIGKLSLRRQAAVEEFRTCRADGGTNDTCRDVVNQYWIDEAELLN